MLQSADAPIVNAWQVVGVASVLIAQGQQLATVRKIESEWIMMMMRLTKKTIAPQGNKGRYISGVMVGSYMGVS